MPVPMAAGGDTLLATSLGSTGRGWLMNLGLTIVGAQVVDDGRGPCCASASVGEMLPLDAEVA